MNLPICYCGTSTVGTPHKTGQHGCMRRVVSAPRFAGKHADLGCDTWYVGDTDQNAITDYSLRRQRGYSQHENGMWTSHGRSVNSIDA